MTRNVKLSEDERRRIHGAILPLLRSLNTRQLRKAVKLFEPTLLPGRINLNCRYRELLVEITRLATCWDFLKVDALLAALCEALESAAGRSKSTQW